MSLAAVRTERTEVARPLKVLVPLIQEDLKLGKEASDMAGMPYYIAAGGKLLEAKDQIAHGEFKSWIQRNFTIKYAQASVYMALAQANEQKDVATSFSSISDFQRQTGRRAPDYNTFESRKPAWQTPVQEVISRVNVEALAKDRLNKEKETEMLRKLSHQLVDIGYKVLAAKLHPDKGGSAEAMARLNNVRRLLKEAI